MNARINYNKIFLPFPSICNDTNEHPHTNYGPADLTDRTGSRREGEEEGERTPI
jgi:hypothetical protein